MDAARRNHAPEQAPVALVVLTAIVVAAGFAMVIAWFTLVVLGQPAPTTVSAGPPTCRVCGVVEGISEGERAALQFIGEQNEGFVVLLAQLGGIRASTAPSRYYETAVLHDDGTVRVVRDTTEPHWKRGDRVRVMRGRVEPLASNVTQH
jgi:hypothetical protein